MSVRGRHVLLFAFLGFVLVFAGLLAMNRTVWWLAPVYWLGHFQAFHIVGHFSIFAGVVILYGPQKRVWALVLGGGVLLELVQFVVGGFPFTRAWLLDSVWDLGVDVTGAAVCWLVGTRHHHTVMPSHLAGDC